MNFIYKYKDFFVGFCDKVLVLINICIGFYDY